MIFFKKTSALQLLIILLFASVFLLIFLLPKSKSSEKPIVNVTSIDTSIHINLTIYAQQNKKTDSIIQLYQKNKINIDAIIQYFNKNQYPQLAAYFEEIKNIHSNSDTVWFNLGKNYYAALGFIPDGFDAQTIIASAARCFAKAAQINDKNNNAKIMLASCYVQTPNPMLGVKMLKELEKTDSNNVLLQMQLAEFSIRSNQLDKAIQRYKKALSLDSSKTEIYAYLSEIYMQKNDTLQSIEFLRKFAARISDTALKSSINNYIQKIKK